jgi:hypothetical protein
VASETAVIEVVEAVAAGIVTWSDSGTKAAEVATVKAVHARANFMLVLGVVVVVVGRWECL